MEKRLVITRPATVIRLRERGAGAGLDHIVAGEVQTEGVCVALEARNVTERCDLGIFAELQAATPSRLAAGRLLA